MTKTRKPQMMKSRTVGCISDMFILSKAIGKKIRPFVPKDDIDYRFDLATTWEDKFISVTVEHILSDWESEPDPEPKRVNLIAASVTYSQKGSPEFIKKVHQKAWEKFVPQAVRTFADLFNQGEFDEKP